MRSTTNDHRSEHVRQRRTTRSQSRLEHTAHYIANPPVTVRGTGMGSPVIQRTSTRPRRVYMVALQNTGPAFTIPAPNIRFGWRALSALLGIGLVALLYFLLNSSQFQIEKPVITGASRTSIADIEAVLKLNGRSIFSVDPYRLAIEIQKSFPELNQISVAVGIPNTVSVAFDERQPVLIWKQKNQARWIDAHGVIFNARGNEPANLVTVTTESEPPRYMVVPTPGPTPTLAATPSAGSATVTPIPAGAVTRVDLGLLTSALVLSKRLPDKAILIYKDKEGLGWRDSRGWDVYFGKGIEELDMKISMVQAIVDQLNQKKVKPVYINLEYINAPYYRLER